MKFIIVGFGIQGRKRKKLLGKECIAVVDKYNLKDSDYSNINEVPTDSYESVILCVPDQEKHEIIKYCLKNKKNILVEKPLIFNNPLTIKSIEKKANKNNVFVLSAYNHRYEKSLKLLKSILDKKKLGKIFFCRMQYLNGTARNVFKTWRDKDAGVLTDLGPHLVDLIYFLIGEGEVKKIKIYNKKNYENLSNDHILFGFNYEKINFLLEISYCNWKNHFQIDFNGSKGAVKVFSLLKWGYSQTVFFKRVMPSGAPVETKNKFIGRDNSFKDEIANFKTLIKKSTKTNLNRDYLVNKLINKIN
jgi:predicted dehydrogenase